MQIENVLDALFEKGVKLVVYTCGAKGGYAFTKTASAFGKPSAVAAVDTTGAGDGFIGAFLYRLYENGVTADTLAAVDEKTLQICVDFAVRFSEISITKRGAMSSYPTMNEMNQL